MKKSFLIPSEVLETVYQFAFKESQSNFLIRASSIDEGLKYEKMYMFDDGHTPLIYDGRFQTQRKKAEALNQVLIACHTHPILEGELISPYSCGWTIKRDKILRNYRDQILRSYSESQTFFEERRELLDKIKATKLGEFRREKLKAGLIGQPNMEVANLISISGISFYITNGIPFNYLHTKAELDEGLEEDITIDYEGDFNLVPRYLKSRVPYLGLLHFKPELVLTQASKEKLNFSILKINARGHESVEGLELKII
ncbi:hypothetical protein HN681_00925 [archaeon]|nr:hypothetical protein [archaeon]MBT3730822.1 hypothetical protein [archaeon]MBT4670136.1 hypothetical protein [archaeon]MBT5030574.1 hypothetical protein [archaeon]MBT5287927.1 hypothetical protein [archaeon]